MITRQVLPQIEYGAPDFYAIVQALSDYITAGYSQYWNDFFESNEGLAQIDLLAYIGDQLHFYLDKRVNNLFLPTVNRRDAALRLASLMGYLSPGPSGAVLNACSRFSIPPATDFSEWPGKDIDGGTFAPGDSITIQGAHWQGQVYVPGPTITVGTLKFEVVDSVSITYADIFTVKQLPDQTIKCDIIVIPFIQGSSVFDQFISDGTAFQSFQTTLVGVINNSWQVCVDGVYPTSGNPGGALVGDGWIQAIENTFVNHPVGSHVYTVDYVGQDQIKVTFGDGLTYGAVPQGDITLSYRTGGGKSSNIAAGVLDPSIHKIAAIYVHAGSNPIEISLDNFQFIDPTSVLYGGSTSYGADSESVDYIRVKAPTHMKSTNRAITNDGILEVSSEFVLGQERIFKVSRSRPNSPLLWGRLNNGVIELADQTGYTFGFVPLTYLGQPVAIYLQSFGMNVEQIFIWGIGSNGQPIKSTDYTDTPGGGIAAALSDYLNKGNFEGGSYLGDIGMTSLYYIVKAGGFATVTINLNSVLVPATGPNSKVFGVYFDPVFDPSALTQQINSVVSSLFNGCDPGVPFQELGVWKAVSAIPGILKFGVQMATPRISVAPHDPTDPAYSTGDIQVPTSQIASLVSSADVIFDLIPKI